MNRSIVVTRKRNKVTYPPKDMLLLVPELLMWALIFCLPSILSVISSFMSDDSMSHFVGLQNYTHLIHDSYFVISFHNTLLFIGIAIACSILLSILIAQVLCARKFSYLMLLFFLIPQFLPAPSIATIWETLCGYGSWLSQRIQHNNVDVWNFTSLLLLFLWKNTSTAVAIFNIGMQQLDRNVLDYARIDGASEWAIFLRIKIPQLKHISIFALYFLTINSIRIFRESYVLFGSYPPISLFFIQHYLNFHFVNLEYGIISAAGSLFSFFLLLIFAIVKQIYTKEVDEI